jgi:hypothetical protein
VTAEMGLPPGTTPATPGLPTAGSTAAGQPLNFADSLTKVLQSFAPQDGLYLLPDIPPKKLRNALSKCDPPTTEQILGLVDCTVFGSAKNCLLFGAEAVYFHNDWSGKTSGRGMISYAEFARRIFASGGFQELSLGHDQYLNISGCGLSRESLIRILDAVKQLVLDSGL